jgi:hypothetical protein
MPIYTHPPLVNYLSYPIVNTVNALADNGVISRIEDSRDLNKAEAMTVLLRIVPMALFAVTMFLVFKLMQLKVGVLAYSFGIPIILSSGLLSESYYFYWDAFMWFFFVLTLYLTEKNSKWAYLTACCLVNTKLVIGMVLLIPLIIKNKKMIFASLSILPFYIATTIITHNPFYMIAHLIPQTSQYAWIYQYWTINIVWNFGLVYYFLLTLPIVFYFKKYPVYVTTYLIILWYAWGFGIAPDKMSAMLYSGALVSPLLCHEYYRKLQGLSLVKE